MSDSVSFDISKKDRAGINKIVTKLIKEYDDYGFERVTMTMDLVACHANGCPLDIERMNEAPLHQLLHDVNGINRHICHDTGKLQNCFLPRFATKVI